LTEAHFAAGAPHRTRPGSRFPPGATRELPQRAVFEAEGETWEHYEVKFAEMGGVVEAWIAGGEKRSPSVQLRVNALGELEVVSSHDQVLGRPTGQRQPSTASRST
jgi:hypothetical protein